MDFELTEDQRAVEDAARRFASRKARAACRAMGRRRAFPVDVMREAAALGFASIYVKAMSAARR
jgi:alkylation response protein AidB-like acyl-CoA dehydrogenase